MATNQIPVPVNLNSSFYICLQAFDLFLANIVGGLRRRCTNGLNATSVVRYGGQAINPAPIMILIELLHIRGCNLSTLIFIIFNWTTRKNGVSNDQTYLAMAVGMGSAIFKAWPLDPESSNV